MSSIAQVATLTLPGTSNTAAAETTSKSQITSTNNLQTSSTSNDDSLLSSTPTNSQTETGAAEFLAPGLTVDSSGKLIWVANTSQSDTDVQATSTSFTLSQASETTSSAMIISTSTTNALVESATSQQVISSVSVSKDVFSDNFQTTSSKKSLLTNSVATIKLSVADVSFRIATTSPKPTTARVAVTNTTTSAMTSSISGSSSTTKAVSSGSKNTSGGLMASETGSASITKSGYITKEATLRTSASSTSSVSLNDGLNDVSAGPTTTGSITDSSSSQATFISDGVTLTGQDAIAALAAEQTSSATVSSGESSSSGKTSTSDDKGLSSLAIVGIVGGVLVSLIIVYIGWYQWRKKRVRKSLGDEIPDGDDDEKQDMKSYDIRQTRSSFGVDVPLTPASSRRRRRRPRSYDDGEYVATWYDGEPRPETEIQYRPETAYEDGVGDGMTEYALTHYGEGLTAALADGMITGTGSPTEGTGPFANTSAQNPFVPPPPVPRVPSAYHTSDRDITHAFQYEDGGRETACGASIYDAYTGVDRSRRQTQMTISEPSTSKLLPWLNKGVSSNVGNVPPVPPLHPQQYDTNEWVQPPPQVQDRAPPRPIMAQTPMALRGNAGAGWGGQAPFPGLR